MIAQVRSRSTGRERFVLLEARSGQVGQTKSVRADGWDAVGSSLILDLVAYRAAKRVGSLICWDGGTLGELRGRRENRAKSGLAGGIRGPAGAFNRGCRRRMLRGIGRVRLDAGPPLFGAVTYPGRDGCWPSAEVAKRDLRALLKRLQRDYPQCGGVWRLGFQKRGAPHFHLLLWGIPFLSRDKLMFHWAGCATVPADLTESERNDWWGHGCDVERARSSRSAGGYAASYCGSTDAEPGPMFCGRRWGWFNAPAIPWATARVYSVEVAATFYNVRRAMAHLSHRRRLPGRSAGITVFCGHPDQLVRLL